MSTRYGLIPFPLSQRRTSGERGHPIKTVLLSMNRSNCHQVLECASPLAFSHGIRAVWSLQSGRGLPHSKTLARGCAVLLRFMVPMHAKKRKEAVHEPLELLPGFGVCQSSGVLPHAGRKVREQKRQRTAAVHDAGATGRTLRPPTPHTTWHPLGSRRIGVRV